MEPLKSHPDKKLYDHLKNVGIKCIEILKVKDLSLKLYDKETIVALSYLIGACHDFGKSTSFFQNKLPPNNVSSNFSHHGLISALFGYIVTNKILGDKTLALITYVVIKKHHGNMVSPIERISNVLQNDLTRQIKDIGINDRYKQVKNMYNLLFENYNIKFDECFGDLDNLINSSLDDFIDDEIFDNLLDIEKYSDDNNIELFLLNNLLYSVLIDTDKKDAADLYTNYFQNCTYNDVSVENYIENLRGKNPEQFSSKIEINKLRNDFFYEVINNTNIKKNNFLYSLTAPTGIGKTFTSFAFANKLKSLFSDGKRIIYCLPYTSIIDQNHEEIENILRFNIEDYDKHPTKYLIKHHHLTAIKLEQDINIKNDSEDYINYFSQKLLIESWEGANIITTFVQLFHSIIGNKNSLLKKFHNIVNSIIILDEVQTLPVEYYNIIGKVFKILAKRFNTYILFLTATQPKIINKEILVKLIQPEKYAKQSEFDRVDLKIKNLNQSISIEEFVKLFKKEFTKKSGLVVCNKIKIAINIYNELESEYSKLRYTVYSLTTNIIPIERKKRIDKIKEDIKNGKKVLVISTQLIEAGVDFSFEVVYRDLAPIDSIVQSAGRSNRNNELKPSKGEVFLFNLNDGKKGGNSIYDSKLIQDTKDILSKEEYPGSDFIDISTKYFLSIDANRESDYLLKGIKLLNYSKENNKDNWGTPIKNFKLIDDNNQKEDIIICVTKEVEEKIRTLNDVLERIKKSGKKIFELETEYEKIENIKKELGNYRINVYTNIIKKYSDIIDEIGCFKFVSYDKQKYLYDDNIGFLTEPKQQLPGCINF